MIINIEEIKKLIEDDSVTAYAISKETGITRQVIQNYRNKEADIMNMSLKNASALQKYIGENKMKEELVVDNLYATHFDNDIHSLEFRLDDKVVYVNYKLGPVDDEFYWDDENNLRIAVEEGDIEIE